MLSSASSVRFCFHRRPCATPPLPSSVPRQAFRCAPLARLQTSVFGSKASRFRGSLLARGFPGCPRTLKAERPKAASFLRGHPRPFCSAPLLGRPPGGFFYRSAKAHRVFAPSSSPPLPTPPHMPTHKASAGGFLFGCAAARAPPPALLRSHPQSHRTSVRASQRRGRASWRDGARRSHHSFCRKALATRFW